MKLMKNKEGIIFYYITIKDTEDPEYGDIKNYLCQDNYVIINDNWLYKIVEH